MVLQHTVREIAIDTKASGYCPAVMSDMEGINGANKVGGCQNTTDARLWRKEVEKAELSTPGAVSIFTEKAGGGEAEGSGRYQAVKGAEDDGGDNWYRVFSSAIWSQCVSGCPHGQENEGGSSPEGPHDVDMGGYLGNDTVTAVGSPIGLVFCGDFNFLRPGGGGALRSEVEGGEGVHSNRVCL